MYYVEVTIVIYETGIASKKGRVVISLYFL